MSVMTVLRLIALILQIAGAVVGIVMAIPGPPPPVAINLPRAVWVPLVVALYSYIIYDFVDAQYYRLRDWRRVVWTAALAFVVLTIIIFPDWRMVGTSVLVAAIGLACVFLL